MKLYKPQDIFDIANKYYNLKLSTKDDKKEITTIKKAITRNLEKLGIKPPYEITQEQANFLVANTMNNYFIKKAKKTNPLIISDAEEYDRMTKEKKPSTLTYNEAVLNAKLDYIISLLTPKKFTTCFDEKLLQENFANLNQHINNQGYPLPGYTEAKRKLEEHPEQYFQKINTQIAKEHPDFFKKFTPESKNRTKKSL